MSSGRSSSSKTGEEEGPPGRTTKKQTDAPPPPGTLAAGCSDGDPRRHNDEQQHRQQYDSSYSSGSNTSSAAFSPPIKDFGLPRCLTPVFDMVIGQYLYVTDPFTQFMRKAAALVFLFATLGGCPIFVPYCLYMYLNYRKVSDLIFLAACGIAFPVFAGIYISLRVKKTISDFRAFLMSAAITLMWTVACLCCGQLFELQLVCLVLVVLLVMIDPPGMIAFVMWFTLLSLLSIWNDSFRDSPTNFHWTLEFDQRGTPGLERLLGYSVSCALSLTGFLILAYFIRKVMRPPRDNTHAPKEPTEPCVIVFTDIQSSTKLWDLIPEIMVDALEIHNSIIRKEILKFNGYEVKTIGDSFMVAFIEPQNALDFALAVQSQLYESEWSVLVSGGSSVDDGMSGRGNNSSSGDQLRTCIGPSINSAYHQILRGEEGEQQEGEEEEKAARDDSNGNNENQRTTTVNPSRPAVVDSNLWNGLRVRIGMHYGFGDPQLDPVTQGYDYFGTLVNTAARIEGLAHGGQVLISAEMFEMVAELNAEEGRAEKRGSSSGIIVSSSMRSSSSSSGSFWHKNLGSFELRGLSGATTIYQVAPLELQKRNFPKLRGGGGAGDEHVVENPVDRSNNRGGGREFYEGSPSSILVAGSSSSHQHHHHGSPTKAIGRYYLNKLATKEISRQHSLMIAAPAPPPPQHYEFSPPNHVSPASTIPQQQQQQQEDEETHSDHSSVELIRSSVGSSLPPLVLLEAYRGLLKTLVGRLDVHTRDIVLGHIGRKWGMVRSPAAGKMQRGRINGGGGGDDIIPSSSSSSPSAQQQQQADDCLLMELICRATLVSEAAQTPLAYIWPAPTPGDPSSSSQIKISAAAEVVATRSSKKHSVSSSSHNNTHHGQSIAPATGYYSSVVPNGPQEEEGEDHHQRIPSNPKSAF